MKNAQIQSPTLLLSFANELVRAGRLNEAERILLGVLEVLPKNNEAIASLGSLYVSNGRLDEAIAVLSSIAATSVKDATLPALLGSAYQGKGLNVKARESYDLALKIDPHHVDAAINSGVILYGDGHRGEAFQRFCKVLQIDPENAVASGNQQVFQFAKESNYGWAIDVICRRYFGNVNVVLELGSRDALDAIWLGRIFPRASVVAFEANPVAVASCQANVIGAKVTNVTVVGEAVSDTNAPIKFFPFDVEKYDNLGASSLFKIDFLSSRNPADPDFGRENPQREIEVTAVRLDDYCQRNHIKQIDILCIDLQGAELLALKGMGKMIFATRYVVAECSHVSTYIGGCTFREVDDLLTAAGFAKLSPVPHDTGYYMDFNVIWENQSKVKFK